MVYMQSMLARSAAFLKAHIESEIWPLVLCLLHTSSWGEQVLWCKSKEGVKVHAEGRYRWREEEKYDLSCLGGVSKEPRQTVEYFCKSKFTSVELLSIKILSKSWSFSEIFISTLRIQEKSKVSIVVGAIVTQFMSFGDHSPRRKGTKEVKGSWDYLPGFMELDLETRSQISKFGFLITLLWKP